MSVDLRRYRLRHRTRPLDVWVAGEGEPLLLLHGWGLSGRVYRGTIMALAEQGYRVAAPSLAVTTGWSMDGVAELAAEAMAGVDLAPAAVVGHSFGGAIGVTLAVKHPDFVRAVVAVSSPLVSLGGLRMSRVLFPGRHYRIVTHAPAAGALLRAAASRAGVGSLARAARWVLANGHDATLKELASSDIPRAIVWAERDSLLTAEIGSEAAEILGCELHIVGTGNGWNGSQPPDHDWPFRHPEHFATTIDEIMDGLLDPRSPDDGGEA